jgi:hypothetical protein
MPMGIFGHGQVYIENEENPEHRIVAPRVAVLRSGAPMIELRRNYNPKFKAALRRR